MSDAGASAGASEAGRLVSLDAFRGFVIAGMIFVNFIGEMPDIAPWLKHAPRTEDTITLPDLVFPAFLLVPRGPTSPDGGFEWIHHGWWGILGLIGWGYLNVSLLYLLARGSEIALLGIAGLLLALSVGAYHGVTDFLGPAVNEFVGV